MLNEWLTLTMEGLAKRSLRVTKKYSSGGVLNCENLREIGSTQLVFRRLLCYGLTMVKRYITQADGDGQFSIIDVFSGLNATFAGRELTRIPADMVEVGLHTLNAIDAAMRAEAELPAESDWSRR